MHGAPGAPPPTPALPLATADDPDNGNADASVDTETQKAAEDMRRTEEKAAVAAAEEDASVEAAQIKMEEEATETEAAAKSANGVAKDNMHDFGDDWRLFNQAPFFAFYKIIHLFYN